MKKSDVKGFRDLVKYATIRSKKSALRNDPQAWAYWEKTYEFAIANIHLEEAGVSLREKWPSYVMNLLTCLSEAGDAGRRADYYSRAKWFRIMCLNQGKRDVKPLSLKWLHDLYKK